ncbi:MAG TPA: ATP-binding protein, partial [Terriglobales bacterium]
KIHSVAGLVPPGGGLLTRRPFRAPHHTISNAGLVGGGSIPRPGRAWGRSRGGLTMRDRRPEIFELKLWPQSSCPYTPTYSSWLNQVEIWFAQIERDVIARGVSTHRKPIRSTS